MNDDIRLLDDVIKDIKHKLRRKEIYAKYRVNNLLKVKAANKKWSSKNRDKIRLKQKIRREKTRIQKGIKKYNRPLTKNSPFVRAFTSVKNSRKYDCFITVDDVREQYQRQNGVCALSGIKLKIPKSSGDRCPKTPDVISVDRIDSSKPYTKNNIQLVCVALNYAKNSFDDKEIKEFISLLRTTHLSNPCSH